MSVKLLTEAHLEFLSLKEAAQARLSLHVSNATLLEITCRGSVISCKYTQLQKKPISHSSGHLWKSELGNENILIPYCVAFSSASFY